MTVTWTAPSGRPTTDWIGLYQKSETNNRVYVAWSYTGGSASGSKTFVAPNTSGDYEFRYLLDDGYVKATMSNTVTVNPNVTSRGVAVPSSTSHALPAAWRQNFPQVINLSRSITVTPAMQAAVNNNSGNIRFKIQVFTPQGEEVTEFDSVVPLWDGHDREGREVPVGSYIVKVRDLESPGSSQEKPFTVVVHR